MVKVQRLYLEIFLRSLKKETIQDKTVLELIKQSKSGITQTGALNIFTEEEFKKYKAFT